MYELNLQALGQVENYWIGVRGWLVIKVPMLPHLGFSSVRASVPFQCITPATLGWKVP